jgi:ATP-dependent DNA helicase RecG
MTSEELENMVAKREKQDLELKESFGIETIETVCAFANASGGLIIIGIDDKGEPAKKNLRVESLRDFENKISTATEPSVAVDVEENLYRGHKVVVIRVQENPLKPVATRGRCFIRKGSVNHQMTPTEIAECHIKSTGGSMDAIIIPGVTKEDIDMEAVRDYMKRSTAKGRRTFTMEEDSWDVLTKLELVKSETEITLAAYLLFAKDPQLKFSQAIIHAGAFKANGAVIIDSRDMQGRIQDQIDETVSFIQKNIHCALIVPTGRIDHVPVWDYPIEAVRETVTNAVCHRDYGSPHDIQIKILDNDLVISSPGELPFDMSLETLMDPNHSSNPRNKLIAKVFFDMGIIEHYGMGITKIKEECEKNSNQCPKWDSSHDRFTTVYKRRGKEDEQGNKKSVKMLSPLQRQILLFLRQHPSATIKQIARALKNTTENIVKHNITCLKSMGILKHTGPKLGGKWEVFFDQD